MRCAVLARLEAQGDHRFDPIYERISARFEHWAALHPGEARVSGLRLTPPPPPAEPEQPTRLAGAGSSPTAGSGIGPLGGVLPPSNWNPPTDSIQPLAPCNCPDANNLLPPDERPGNSNGAGGSNGSSGSSSSYNGSSTSGSSGGLTGQTWHLESDSNLVTGEYFQSHTGGFYQAQGVISGVEFQYSSLQADPYPIYSAFLTTQTGSDSSLLTSIKASLTVNSVSEGSAVTYTPVSLVDGQTYLVQLQVTTVSSYATGLYPAALSITKTKSGGMATENFTTTQMVVNRSASPYGDGWSIAGLQQIIFNASAVPVMVTDGQNAPELLTSTGTNTWAGASYDLSSFYYNSATFTYTRTYTDGTVVTFNSTGQETSVKDRNGNITSYAYVSSGTAAGAVQTITDPVGLVTTLTYNGTTGKLATVIEPSGAVTTFTFSSNNLVAVQDPDNAITSYGYNGSAEMTTEVNPNNQTATITYDSFGRMSSEQTYGGLGTFSTSPAEEAGLVAAGGTTPLVYPSSFIGHITDADSATTTVLFDGMGGILTDTDGRGNTTTITRNSHDLPTVEVDPLGRTTTIAYDASGNPTTITQADGATETILYNDDFGIPTYVVDFDGNVTSYTLDSNGNVTKRTDPDGQSENYTYNAAGQVLTDTDPLGKTVTHTYNGLGQLTSITEPGTSIATVQYAYDSAGNVTAITDEVGDTVTYSYDQMGRLKTAQNPVQAAASKDVAYSYDAAGNLTSVTDALGHTVTLTYNANNELVSVRDALNNITTYGYDAEGNVTTVEDARGYTTTNAYDKDNNLISVTDPLNNINTYVYDADNEVVTMINPTGGATTYTYNSLGDLSTVVLPGQSAPTSYTYDENGNGLSVTDQLGDKTVYTYNNMGWQSTETVYPNGSTAETTTYSYDYDGDLTAVTDGLSHTTSYAYNATGDLISETQPTGGGTTTYSYDLAHRLKSLTDPDNNITTWTYTSANEVATEVSPLGHPTTYSYDLNGNVTSVIDPNSHKITYSYDADNAETGETWVNPGMGSPLNLVTITYDADHNVTQLKDANSNYQYTYNADDEVSTFADNGTTGLPLVTLTYGYDGNNNVTSESDSLGGLLTLTYDARDELTNEKFTASGLSDEAVTYAYDDAGRLTRHDPLFQRCRDDQGRSNRIQL